MDTLGQIPLSNLSERDILLITYQELQNVSKQFEAHKVANEKQSNEVDCRLDAIEKQLHENAMSKAMSDTRYSKQMKWIAVAFTGCNIVFNVVIYFLNHRA